MTLIVFDTGLRTSTPWYDIFPPKDVERLAQIKATQRVETHEERPADSDRDGAQRHDNRNKTAVYEKIGKPATPHPAVELAQDIMTTRVTTLDKDSSINAAWQIFQARDFRHIPVLNNGRLVGIVSERDILSRTSTIVPNKQPAHLGDPVHTVMSSQVLAGRPDTEIRLIASVFKDHHIGAMPIVDEYNKLKGIVTRSDILEMLITRVGFTLWS